MSRRKLSARPTTTVPVTVAQPCPPGPLSVAQHVLRSPVAAAQVPSPVSLVPSPGLPGIALVLSLLMSMPALAQDTDRRQIDETPAPIAAWSRTTAADESAGTPAERGAAVFNNWCSACHSRGPMNAPGTTSLEFKYRGELPAALEDRKDLTPELIEFYVRNGIAMMPIFRKTELSAADVAALSAYLGGN